MPRPPRQIRVTPRMLFRRPRVLDLPLNLQHVVSEYSLARREEGLSAGGHRRYLTGGINLHALRNLSKNDPHFSDYLSKVRKSVAGQIAITAKENGDLFEFLKNNRYVLIDGRGHLTGANFKGFPGIRRARIATEDIRWLVNHL